MKIIGHRGAKGLAPENTLASFAKALKHNVDQIECDIRVTKDGVPVMEHDEWLHNQAGERFKVTDHTYAELLKHKPELPTLEQCIRSVNRAVSLYLEVKPGVPTEPVVECITKLLGEDWQEEDFMFGSDDFKVLAALHEAFPKISLIVIESWSGVRATSRARKLGTKYICMNHCWMWSGFIRGMCRGGYRLCVYTLNNRKRAERFARYGLYGVVTDYPDLYEPK